jgi:hypothetical protein
MKKEEAKLQHQYCREGPLIKIYTALPLGWKTLVVVGECASDLKLQSTYPKI